jgi:charged multivesicular body protein 4
MSGVFGKLFGGKKGDKAPTTGEAIQKLRETEEMLMKKQEFLEKKIETEITTARKNAKTNKRVALGALKRKKRYDKQLQQIDGTLTTIEQQREALEGANTNTAVLQTMGEAAKAMKKAHADMDVDQVHDMMDDIAEQQDVAREISDAISSPVAFGQEFDEDELEAELNELEAETELEEQADLEKQLLDVGPKTELPEVPKAEPAVPSASKPKAAKKQEDDDDMAELAAWAS